MNITSRKKKAGVDFLKEAVLYGTKGAGVTTTTGPAGEVAYAFNGTSTAYFEFPASKKALFNFINKPFELEMVIWLNSTNAVQPFGNLMNSTGIADYAITLNNTYQTVCKFSLDGYESSLPKRLRFGIGAEKLATGRWVNLKLKRLADGGTVQFLLDDVVVSSFSNITTFNNASPNLFRIGSSSDGFFPVNGIISKLTVTSL